MAKLKTFSDKKKLKFIKWFQKNLQVSYCVNPTRQNFVKQKIYETRFAFFLLVYLKGREVFLPALWLLLSKGYFQGALKTSQNLIQILVPRYARRLDRTRFGTRFQPFSVEYSRLFFPKLTINPVKSHFFEIDLFGSQIVHFHTMEYIGSI